MERNPLPDRSREEQIDRSSSDASHNNISLRQHMKMFGQRNDQQARTNEAPTSGLDGHGARQIEDVWDKGKNKLSPDEERLHEEQRKSTPIGPDGQRVPRAFDLATTCTPDHLILVGAGNGASTSHDSSLKHAYTLTKEHLEQGRHEEAKKLCESVATKLVQEFGPENSRS